jgi:RHS repeat-associated protein
MTPGVVAESDLAGATKNEYIFFDGERVARRDGATGAGGVFYYFSDHLKTASVITDSAGVIKAESDYYPWGGELQFVNNDSNDYKFTGKKRDIETGLDYFGARYYSNGLGRWVSADWSSAPVPVPYADFGDPQSLNQYGYARNIPTSRIDPDGHCTADGEKHSLLWCIGHALGINETQKEKTARIEGERAVLLDPKHTAHESGKPLTPAERYRIEHMTPEQVDSTYKAILSQGIQAGSPPPIGAPGGGSKWNYGSNKSAQKWQNQMSKRGWTEQQINEAIDKGQQFPAPKQH